ncbi:uncharacterized protein LOC119276303 [Triticum dicoccoides]|uniref:uncharacterized protein LOC119276303 n=1 Tax=Triticum dicoccoides TaxID=85692 RepID=UPI000E7B0C9D|nr:uncharacterized protein LOC119276303 [Triticum dicoccoides]XP_037413236.1 uncharacterized protein LOC119276303 [Triticum dicoccoides]
MFHVNALRKDKGFEVRPTDLRSQRKGPVVMSLSAYYYQKRGLSTALCWVQVKCNSTDGLRERWADDCYRDDGCLKGHMQLIGHDSSPFHQCGVLLSNKSSEPPKGSLITAHKGYEEVYPTLKPMTSATANKKKRNMSDFSSWEQGDSAGREPLIDRDRAGRRLKGQMQALHLDSLPSHQGYRLRPLAQRYVGITPSPRKPLQRFQLQTEKVMAAVGKHQVLISMRSRKEMMKNVLFSRNTPNRSFRTTYKGYEEVCMPSWKPMTNAAANKMKRKMSDIPRCEQGSSAGWQPLMARDREGRWLKGQRQLRDLDSLSFHQGNTENSLWPGSGLNLRNTVTPRAARLTRLTLSFFTRGRSG